MSILSRCKDIMEANFNAMLDKLEDPAKMIDQYLRNCEKDLAKVKAETAEVMAQEERAKRVLENCEKEIKELEELAVEAIKKGEEEKAVKLVQKKVVLSENLSVYKASLATAEENSEKMRQMHSKLRSDYELLKEKQALLKSKAALVKTKTRLNKANYEKRGVSGINKLDKINERLDSELDKMNAMERLDKEDSITTIKEQYRDAKVSAEVEREMEKLRGMLNA